MFGFRTKCGMTILTDSSTTLGMTPRFLDYARNDPAYCVVEIAAVAFGCFAMTNYTSRNTSYESRVTGPDFLFVIYELRTTNYELRTMNYEL